MTDPTALQWDLWGTIVGSGTDYGVYAPDGWLSTPEADPVVSPNGFSPGRVLSRTQLGPRDLQLTFEVSDPTDADTLRALTSAAAVTPQTVRFMLTDTVERVEQVVLIQRDSADEELELVSGLYRFPMRFRAFDPLIYSDTATTLNLDTAGTDSGTVTNAGDYGPTFLPGDWTATVTASGSGCVGPKLVNTHADFGGAAVLDAHDVTLGAGDTLVLSAAGERITADGVSVYGDCRGASSGTPPVFFALVPGAQTVELSCQSGDCTVAFTYRSARL